MEGNTKKRWAVYTIRERQGLEKPYWMRVGVAFMNRDGSVNLHLDAMPLDGKLQMREWKEDTGTTASAAAETDAPDASKRPRPNGKAAAEAVAL